MSNKTYIGDGVYAEFDGFQIWLRTDSNEIAIEPSVWVQLIKYASQFYVPTAGKTSTTCDIPGDTSAKAEAR